MKGRDKEEIFEVEGGLKDCWKKSFNLVNFLNTREKDKLFTIFFVTNISMPN